MQAWNEHSQSNKDRAEAEMARSQKLRELIFHLIEQTTNDLRVQGGGRRGPRFDAGFMAGEGATLKGRWIKALFVCSKSALFMVESLGRSHYRKIQIQPLSSHL